jgi:hypothetical protein
VKQHARAREPEGHEFANAVGRLMRADLEAPSPVFAHRSQKSLHLRAQAIVIVFQGQQIIGLLLSDLRGDRLLAVQRVHRHDTAFDVQPPQDFRDRRDLIRAVGDIDLPQGQALRSRPGADKLDRVLLLGFIVRATQRLAVQRDNLPIRQLDLRVDPFEQTSLELRRGNHAQDTPEGVVRRNAEGQFQKLLQPFRFGLTESFHIGGAFGAADHGAQTNNDDVNQLMPFAASLCRLSDQCADPANRQNTRLEFRWKSRVIFQGTLESAPLSWRYR